LDALASATRPRLSSIRATANNIKLISPRKITPLVSQPGLVVGHGDDDMVLAQRPRQLHTFLEEGFCGRVGQSCMTSKPTSAPPIFILPFRYAGTGN
jgi:hypothetical protein